MALPGEVGRWATAMTAAWALSSADRGLVLLGDREVLEVSMGEPCLEPGLEPGAAMAVETGSPAWAAAPENSTSEERLRAERKARGVPGL